MPKRDYQSRYWANSWERVRPLLTDRPKRVDSDGRVTVHLTVPYAFGATARLVKLSDETLLDMRSWIEENASAAVFKAVDQAITLLDQDDIAGAREALGNAMTKGKKGRASLVGSLMAEIRHAAEAADAEVVGRAINTITAHASKVRGEVRVEIDQWVAQAVSQRAEAGVDSTLPPHFVIPDDHYSVLECARYQAMPGWALAKQMDALHDGEAQIRALTWKWLQAAVASRVATGAKMHAPGGESTPSKPEASAVIPDPHMYEEA